jgi:hypothetical protein
MPWSWPNTIYRAPQWNRIVALRRRDWTRLTGRTPASGRLRPISPGRPHVTPLNLVRSISTVISQSRDHLSNDRTHCSTDRTLNHRESDQVQRGSRIGFYWLDTSGHKGPDAPVSPISTVFLTAHSKCWRQRTLAATWRSPCAFGRTLVPESARPKKWSGTQVAASGPSPRSRP